MDIVNRLKELTDVDFERDSAVSEQAQLHLLLTQLMENEARSGSMDCGCVTPLYAYRMLGGHYSMEDIESGLKEVRKQGFLNLHP